MAVTAPAGNQSYYSADQSERVLDTRVGGILRDAAQAVPDQPALIGGHPDPAERRRWTYADLLQDAERRARALLGRFAPGERVAVSDLVGKNHGEINQSLELAARALSVLGALACVVAALALAAPAQAAEAACASVKSEPVRTTTEQHRQESSVDPANGQPYAVGLPECRAYEMVSPLYKQSYSVGAAGGSIGIGLPVAPGGETAEFVSAGTFAGAENYIGTASVQTPYISQRSPLAWTTSSTYPPAELRFIPTLESEFYDAFSPDLRSLEGGCFLDSALENLEASAIGCAIRKEGGAWEPTPPSTASTGSAQGNIGRLTEAASTDLSRVFFFPRASLFGKEPTLDEESGLGTASPELRRVNVDASHKVLAMHEDELRPFLGDERTSPPVQGTAYHAVSESGETVFFTAARVVGQPQEGKAVAVLYARIPCKGGPNCSYVYVVEPDEQRVEATETNTPVGGKRVEGTGRETIAISKPAPKPECTGPCESDPPADATFQGASADGSKVFFTTEQKLLDSDTNTSPELYEWHCASPCEHPSTEGKLTLISAGEPKTTFEGVGRTSSDGSHVYFVEHGLILTTRPHTQNKNANGEEASETQKNLYGYDTETGETKFVAATGITGLRKEGNSRQAMQEHAESAEVSTDTVRPAQTTPDGRYLVFSSPQILAKDTNEGAAGPLAVYRYDFQTGELTWVSHAVPACAGEGCGRGGMSAWVAPVPGTNVGAEPEIDDFNRAISGCPEEAATKPFAGCKAAGEHDGEYVVFTTNEKLQNSDVNSKADVYEWHCASPCEHPDTEGVVSMISAGNGVAGGERPETAMSASGSDIFLFTTTALVKQDTDELGDLYDARAPRSDEPAGFLAPKVEPSCSGEACQGNASEPQTFGLATSSQSTARGNLLPPAAASLAFRTSTPKPGRRAQELAKALKACKGKPRKKRAACESQARKKYAGKAKAKKKVKAKKRTGEAGDAHDL